MRKLILSVLLMMISSVILAQECGCDFTIPDLPINSVANAQTYDAVGKTGTICIPKSNRLDGKRVALTIKNVTGTQLNPVIIKNCGGQVEILSNFGYGLQLLNCKFFILDGSQETGILYGLKINGGQQGITCTERTTNGTIKNVEVLNSGFAGIMVKSDPYCPTATRSTVTMENFTLRNFTIENNYIHHMVRGEGIYFGYTFPVKTLSPCGTVVNSHRSKNVKIFNNRIEFTGSDALQVSQCDSALEIYGNMIKSYGISPFNNFQNSGISLGALNKGKIYNNFVDGKNYIGDLDGGNSISIIGSQYLYIFNNILVNSNGKGIYSDMQNYANLTPISNTYLGLLTANNVIILKAGRVDDGIQGRTPANTGQYYNINNIVVTAGTAFRPYTKPGFSAPQFTNTSNITSTNISSIAAQFESINTQNYNLKSTSSYIGAGVNVPVFNFDYSNVERTGNYSIGSFEFVAPPVPNVPPVASTSANDTVFITNSPFTLSGSGTDADGQIVSYNWNTTNNLVTLLNSNLQSSSFSVLDTGNYIFTFTVTDNNNATHTINKNVYVKAPFVFQIDNEYEVKPLIQNIEITTTFKDTLNDLSIELSAGDTVFYKYSIKNTYTNTLGCSFEFLKDISVEVNSFSYGTKNNTNLSGSNYLTGYFINTSNSNKRVHILIVANGLTNTVKALRGSYAEFYKKK